MYQTRSTTRRALSLAAGTVLLLAACGDDDGDGGSDGGNTQTTAGPAEVAADPTGTYCDAALAIEQAGEPAIDETMSPEQAAAAMEDFAGSYRPLLQAALDTAPDDIAGDGEVVVAAFEEMVDTGDPAAFENPDVQAALTRIHDFDLDNCGWNTVEVTARDYAFEGLPATLPAGPTNVELTNEGTEIHHMVLARINDDVTMPVDELLQLDQDEAMAYVELAPAEPFTFPGESDYAVNDLRPGRYIAACFIPTGTTSFDSPEEGPPHFTHGMVTELTVE